MLHHLLLLSLVPGPQTIGQAHGAATPPCSESLRDASSGLCGLLASSEPKLGMLYPLSSAFNLDGNGHVGIGTVTPLTSLHVAGSDGFLVGSTASGPGTRLFWSPAKAALRAGRVTGDQWDDVNIGFGSFGLGENSL